MRQRSVAVILVFLLATTLTGVGAAHTEKTPLERSAYIVVLKSDAEVDETVADHVQRFGIEPSYVYEHALGGYSATFSSNVAAEIAADPRVESVVPDGPVWSYETQPDAPWGLDRTDQRRGPLNGTYAYTTTGNGVTVYIIDSGIRFTHVEFEGRAKSGFDAVDGGQADDCYGHGTHVAGLVGGKTYGAAKSVALSAVRVTDCTGRGTWSTVIAGVDWVVADHRAGTPAIANMSLGGARNSAADQAVKAAIADGVMVVAAAGNSSEDACDISPAGVPDVVTVAASTKSDAWAFFSNEGPCVDIVAPGVKIISATNTSDTATAVASGTSMSAPLVAGVGARYLELNPQATKKQFAKAIIGTATNGILTDVPPNTPNKLIYRNPGS